MNAFVLEWFASIWQVLAESGPYLLVGFLLAGLIKVLIPEDKVFRYLGKDNFKSVFVASCVGVPLPLCSCSVIPTALALKQSGASKGATTAFLISTPETGVDSIGITWALMDPIMTIVRPLAALLTAVGCGTVVNFLVRRGMDGADAPPAPEEPEHEPDCCHHEAVGRHVAEVPISTPTSTPTASTTYAPVANERRSVLTVLRQAFRYAFGPLMADLTPWFILGFLLSGLILVLVPDDFFSTVLPEGFGWLSMLLMLVVGIPLYICATASTPIAAALVAKGLDPGAALVLLLAGPATNLSTLFFVRGFLGKQVLRVYLVGIALACLLLGYLVNLLYSVLEIDPVTTVTSLEDMSKGLVAVVAGSLLLLLLAWHAARLGLLPAFLRRLQGWCAPLGFDPLSLASRICLGAALLVLYLATAYSVILPGQVGFLMRFGDVRQVLTNPGVRLHGPYPLESVETVANDFVRSVEFGFDSSLSFADWSFAAEQAGTRNLDAESEVVTGDENLLRITYVTHYSVSDAYRYRFSLDDPDALVRVLTESSLRRVVARHTSDEVLVASREELQHEIGALLREELDGLASGLAVRAVILLDVHSPPQTHYAYRDVASAQEDRERSARRAEGYRVERVSQARADAYRLLQEAESNRKVALDRALGEVAAFLALQAQPGAVSAVNRLRLQREAAEQALAEARLILLLSDRTDVYLTSPGGNSILPEDR